MIDKINNDCWYLSNFDDTSRINSVNISISKRYEVYSHLSKDTNFVLDFKDSAIIKEAKDFLNICLLLDGYKINCERFKIDYTSYLDWLSVIIDNYLINQYLMIDEKFFSIEAEFLSYIIIFLSRFEKFTIKLKFLDTNYLNIFLDVFTRNSNQNSKVEFKKLSCLKILKFVK
jgi:hypothetical protein